MTRFVRSGHTIILLDDEDAVLRATRRMLKAHGHLCYTATVGEEVLSLLGDMLPDLVILDIKIVGGLGGIETMQSIRQLGFTMPIFSMSGYSASEIFETPNIEEGFTAHSEKPFDGNRLSALISEYC